MNLKILKSNIRFTGKKIICYWKTVQAALIL